MVQGLCIWEEVSRRFTLEMSSFTGGTGASAKQASGGLTIFEVA